MEMIHPVVEEHCRAHYGKTVLVVLNDGTQIPGVLSKVEGGKLYLNAEEGEAVQSSKLKSASTKSKKTVKRQVKTSAYGFGAGFGFGPALALDLALITLLFVL
ncbi:hypothetical protein [Paenibacillus thalictri]|uniref:DUF2642 domain-containing protein n=1 Tax=Paenibacillus thalictri TaxID=2527873 RepID=A0A4Q9DDY1_9BACL|nr:hypothetical protein [Paenibacillus thalictri]TBL67923.1 hypothetical protein EYB31_39230 [Paenibacillus thalictri]